MIDKCFRCDGSGTNTIAEWSDNRVGTVPTLKQVKCARCLGSGALDYRIVEGSPSSKAGGNEDDELAN